MLGHKPFYHELIKKVVVSFGTLFSDVQIIRRTDTDTSKASTTKENTQIIHVPITYGPKEKIFARLDSYEQEGLFMSLPRLSFEIVGYTPNPEEATNKTNRIRCSTTEGQQFVYTPVPYDLDIQMTLISKGTEDALAVIEQIIPLFNPDFQITIRSLPEMNININVPIVLKSISTNYDYESDFRTRSLTYHTFDFTAKMRFIGPIHYQGVIHKVDVDLGDGRGNDTYHVQGDPESGEIILDEWELNTEVKLWPDINKK